MDTKRIPFEVETSRVIELLAKQIYQSPLALLRENVQNAFDAIRERQQRGDNFSPDIDVNIDDERITITDNGIGMSPEELQRHFWTAGSSSKNTAEARAAGVVGTFGIGAMANFGIASKLTVETESVRTGQRTLSWVKRDELSLREDCVEVKEYPPTGNPGTKITADLIQPGSVPIEHARQYLREFVRLVNVPIRVNGQLISQTSIDKIVPKFSPVYNREEGRENLGTRLHAFCHLAVSNNAVARIVLSDIEWDGRRLPGYIALRSGDGVVQAARSGFGLAMAPVSSVYVFGGVVDLTILEPTAGREAITSEGVQLLQSIFNEIDTYVTKHLASIDQCNLSTPFMQWVYMHGRHDLMGRLTIEAIGRDDIALQDAAKLTTSCPVRVYGGSDPTVIRTFATENSVLLVLSRTSPRRQCQEIFLNHNPRIEAVPDKPTVIELEEGMQLSGAKWGVGFRLETIISDDYFVEATVAFGKISHGVSIIVEKNDAGKLKIILGSNAANVSTLIQVFETYLEAFRSLAKDFVRNVIFPHIAHLVPSSTRQGAQAFIEAMRRKRETFEYDSEELDELPSIWQDYREGRITLESAIDRSKFSARTNIQYVDGASSVREVVPDLIENEANLQPNVSATDQRSLNESILWSAEPPIMRTESSSPAKLIIVDKSEPDLRGYRCFIALAPKAYADFGDFFTQPHSTSVVWGGQNALFIFIHHSGEFGVYYDMQTTDFVGDHAGGGSQKTSTIILKDKIYIPIPQEIQANFIPSSGERKRFEIKSDLIRIGSQK